MADAFLPGLSDDICPIEYDACCADWDVSATSVLLRLHINKEKLMARQPISRQAFMCIVLGFTSLGNYHPMK